MYSILYVDDDEVLLGLNKIYLERTGEFLIDTSPSAQEGLRRIGDRAYDAVVSDYDMPHMDGIHFLKEVRRLHGDLPFLLFTGKGREEVVIEAVDNGVDFYIQKGHDMHGMIAELRYKIRRAIEQRRTRGELEQSRQQMNDIINFLPDATFVRDIHGRVIAWNRAMEKMTGVARGEMIGKGDYSYALPIYREKRPLLADIVLDEGPEIDPRYRFFERRGDTISSEVHIPHLRDGRGAHLWVTASPLYDSDGAVTGAIESFRDISDAYALKRDLSRSREMNQGFADMIPVGIYEMNLSHTLTFANRVCLAWFGIEPEDLNGTISILDFIDPCDQERAVSDIRNIISGKGGSGQEYILRRKDMTPFSGLIYAGKITDPETGQPAGVRGVIVDQTEKKKEAQTWYEDRERLALALKAGDMGIWDVDLRSMVIADIHEWAHGALGYTKEDLPAITVNVAKSLVHPLDLPRLLLRFFLHISGKEPLFESEFRLAAKDGSWRWVAVRGMVIERNDGREPVRLTGVINLITRPKT